MFLDMMTFDAPQCDLIQCSCSSPAWKDSPAWPPAEARAAQRPPAPLSCWCGGGANHGQHPRGGTG